MFCDVKAEEKTEQILDQGHLDISACCLFHPGQQSPPDLRIESFTPFK